MPTKSYVNCFLNIDLKIFWIGQFTAFVAVLNLTFLKNREWSQDQKYAKTWFKNFETWL